MPQECVIALSESRKGDGSDRSGSTTASLGDSRLDPVAMGGSHTLEDDSLASGGRGIWWPADDGQFDLGRAESQFWIETIPVVGGGDGDATPDELDILVGTLRLVMQPAQSGGSKKAQVATKPRRQVLSQVTQKDPKKVKRLNLKESGICRILPAITMCKHLTVLILRKNNLSSLPEELGQMISLTVLDISNNRLGRLPASLGKLRALVELNLSHNALDSLPASIAHLARLRELCVANNLVRTIPRDFGGLSQLVSLDLAHNLLEFLPAELCQIRTLRRITLQGNPLLTPGTRGGLKSTQKVSWPPKSCTLYERASRAVLGLSEVRAEALTHSIRLVLKTVQRCNFCHGPFVQSFSLRVRFLRRGGLEIPFAFYLCSNHWDGELSRIRAMFSGIPQTFPDAELGRIRQFGIWHTTR